MLLSFVWQICCNNSKTDFVLSSVVIPEACLARSSYESSGTPTAHLPLESRRNAAWKFRTRSSGSVTTEKLESCSSAAAAAAKLFGIPLASWDTASLSRVCVCVCVCFWSSDAQLSVSCTTLCAVGTPCRPHRTVHDRIAQGRDARVPGWSTTVTFSLQGSGDSGVKNNTGLWRPREDL